MVIYQPEKVKYYLCDLLTLHGGSFLTHIVYCKLMYFKLQNIMCTNILLFKVNEHRINNSGTFNFQ